MSRRRQAAAGTWFEASARRRMPTGMSGRVLLAAVAAALSACSGGWLDAPPAEPAQGSGGTAVW